MMARLNIYHTSLKTSQAVRTTKSHHRYRMLYIYATVFIGFTNQTSKALTLIQKDVCQRRFCIKRASRPNSVATSNYRIKQVVQSSSHVLQLLKMGRSASVFISLPLTLKPSDVVYFVLFSLRKKNLTKETHDGIQFLTALRPARGMLSSVHIQPTSNNVSPNGMSNCVFELHVIQAVVHTY